MAKLENLLHVEFPSAKRTVWLKLIGDEIEAKRMERKMSQEELARAVGITFQEYSNLIRGYGQNVRLSSIRKVGVKLRVSMDLAPSPRYPEGCTLGDLAEEAERTRQDLRFNLTLL